MRSRLNSGLTPGEVCSASGKVTLPRERRPAVTCTPKRPGDSGLAGNDCAGRESSPTGVAQQLRLFIKPFLPSPWRSLAPTSRHPLQLGPAKWLARANQMHACVMSRAPGLDPRASCSNPSRRPPPPPGCREQAASDDGEARGRCCAPAELDLQNERPAGLGSSAIAYRPPV